MADQSGEHSDGRHGPLQRPHTEGPLGALPLPGGLLPSGSWRHSPHIRTSVEPQELAVQSESAGHLPGGTFVTLNIKKLKDLSCFVVVVLN